VSNAAFARIVDMPDLLRKLRWRFVAQLGELRFHQRNEWRQSPDFMRQTATLFDWWGYSPKAYAGEIVVDIGAGSRLRSRYFDEARIAAVEPLADRYRKSIAWSDLGDADLVFSVPAERLVPDIVGLASLVMCINVLDHVYDPDAVVRNAASYLRRDGSFLLSVDLHEHGSAGHMHPVDLDMDGLHRSLTQAGFDIERTYDGLGPTGQECYGHGTAHTVVARLKPGSATEPC
jgi:SAM-dependent methyltransferase